MSDQAEPIVLDFIPRDELRWCTSCKSGPWHTSQMEGMLGRGLCPECSGGGND